MIIMLTEK